MTVLLRAQLPRTSSGRGPRLHIPQTTRCRVAFAGSADAAMAPGLSRERFLLSHFGVGLWEGGPESGSPPCLHSRLCSPKCLKDAPPSRVQNPHRVGGAAPNPGSRRLPAPRARKCAARPRARKSAPQSARCARRSAFSVGAWRRPLAGCAGWAVRFARPTFGSAGSGRGPGRQVGPRPGPAAGEGGEPAALAQAGDLAARAAPTRVDTDE